MARRKRQAVKRGDLRKNKEGDTFIVLDVEGKMCHIKEYGLPKQPIRTLKESVYGWEYKGECKL